MRRSSRRSQRRRRADQHRRRRGKHRQPHRRLTSSQRITSNESVARSTWREQACMHSNSQAQRVKPSPIQPLNAFSAHDSIGRAQDMQAERCVLTLIVVSLVSAPRSLGIQANQSNRPAHSLRLLSSLVSNHWLVSLSEEGTLVHHGQLQRARRSQQAAAAHTR